MVQGLLEILTERRNQTFCKPIDVHSVTYAIECFFNKRNNVNRTGKHDFFCCYIFPVDSKLLEREETFP